MCTLDIIFYFIQVEVHRSYYICGFISFTYFEKKARISPNTVYVSFSFSSSLNLIIPSLFFIPIMFFFNCVSGISYMLFFIIYNYFFRCFFLLSYPDLSFSSLPPVVLPLIYYQSHLLNL